MANIGWKERFPATTITHLVSHASDHLPLIMQTRTDIESRARGALGFKFEESWLLWEDCEKTVEESWRLGNRTGSAIAVIQEKIKDCGADLMAWGVSKTHPNAKEIKRLQEKIEALTIGELNEENKAEFTEVSKRLDDLLTKQEIYWHQRSRVSWLKHGDKNT